MVTVTGIEGTFQKSKEKDLEWDFIVIMAKLKVTIHSGNKSTVFHRVSLLFTGTPWAVFRNAYSSIELFVLFCVCCVCTCMFLLVFFVFFFCYPKKICFNVNQNQEDNLPIYQCVVIISKQDLGIKTQHYFVKFCSKQICRW